MAKRMNGWQRIWIVLSGLLLLWMLGKGWGEFISGQTFRNRMQGEAIEQVASPACKDIATAPWRQEWASLAYNHPCNTLAIVRQYMTGNPPLTVASINAKYDREYWETMGMIMAMYGGFAIVLSLLTYAMAWIAVKTFRWIRAGFTREGG